MPKRFVLNVCTLECYIKRRVDSETVLEEEAITGGHGHGDGNTGGEKWGLCC